MGRVPWLPKETIGKPRSRLIGLEIAAPRLLPLDPVFKASSGWSFHKEPETGRNLNGSLRLATESGVLGFTPRGEGYGYLPGGLDRSRLGFEPLNRRRQGAHLFGPKTARPVGPLGTPPGSLSHTFLLAFPGPVGEKPREEIIPRDSPPLELQVPPRVLAGGHLKGRHGGGKNLVVCHKPLSVFGEPPLTKAFFKTGSIMTIQTQTTEVKRSSR